MSADRELLQLAAKAEGIDGWWEESYISFIKRSGGPWNPLTDDGDALRLAVKLGLFLDTRADTQPRFETDEPSTMVLLPRPSEKSVGEWHNDDPYAATRRAIVRAAAEIGKTIQWPTTTSSA